MGSSSLETALVSWGHPKSSLVPFLAFVLLILTLLLWRPLALEETVF